MTNQSADNTGVPDLVSACRLMLRFARKSGTDLSPKLERQIAQLDSTLKHLKLPPVTDIPAVLVSDRHPATEEESPPDKSRPSNLSGAAGALPGATSLAAPEEAAAEANPLLSGTELILEVHGELSRVVAPATAMSLQSSEPPPGKHRFLGGMPLIVKAAAIVALLSAIGFVASAGVIASKAAAANAASKGATPPIGGSQGVGKP